MNKRKREEISVRTIRDAIEKHGRFRFRVKGVSMFPFLIDGDEVIIERVLPEDLRTGDIVMYVRKNVMIVHRIIRIHTTAKGRRLFIIRGDNLSYEDQPVWEEDIGGKATKVIRGSREFTPPSFHPIVISAARFILNRARQVKSLLGLRISHKDITESLRRNK